MAVLVDGGDKDSQSSLTCRYCLHMQRVIQASMALIDVSLECEVLTTVSRLIIIATIHEG